MARTIKDEISGKPVVIENPLLAEHIEKDRLLWYYGHTSVSGWDCPAIITRVDKKRRRFKVRSLDDMREQCDWYDFDPDKDQSSSRQTMRLVTKDEVAEYLDKRRQRLERAITVAEDTCKSTKASLESFDEIRKTLPL